MGYHMDQVDSRFRIPAAKKVEALAALKAMDRSRGGGEDSSGKQWSWVNQDTVNQAATLEEALIEWRYEPEVDEDGNITDLHFSGQKLGDDAEMLGVLAPFVEEGSFIEMNGEDDDVWRWRFKNGKMEEVTPEVIWPE